MQIAIWILAPLACAALGYVFWQAVRARAELRRVLRDAGAIAALFNREGKRLLELATADPRIHAALKDETRLSLSTTVLHLGVERRYGQRLLACGVPIVLIAAAVGLFLHPLAALLALGVGCAGLAAPVSAVSVAAVHRDLGALALSLKIWYEYDPEICTDVIGVTGIFEPLFAYVSAHYISRDKVQR